MKERPRERARLRGLADREGIDVSNLYIAVTGADKGTQRRAVEALQAAGIEIYRAWIEPSPIELAEARERDIPDRKHLVGRRVRLTLNEWARRGPTEGVFGGQGERGLSIVVEGGGRIVYSHHEVAEVTPA